MYKNTKAFKHPCLFQQTLCLIAESNLKNEARNLLQQLFWKAKI